MSSGAVGIDFGTATTIVAFRSGDASEIFVDPVSATVIDPLDPHLIPSYISFHPNGQILAGREAKARRTVDPANTAHSFKRIIGLEGFQSAVKQFREWYQTDLDADADDIPRFVTRGGSFTAAGLATHLFTQLLSYEPIAAAAEGAVITVPPSFEKEQAEAIRKAAEQAGFSKVRLLSEAYAAALPYVEGDEADQTVVVYDLGGGTFDIAVLRCIGRAHVLLAYGGDAYLGGDDVDLKLAEWVAKEVLAAHRWDLRTDFERYKALVWACEQAKVQLSSLESLELMLGQIDSVLDGKTLTVTRPQLEKLLYDLVQRTFVICDEVLQRARTPVTAIDQVIVSGGGGNIPYVRQTVEKYFGKAPRKGKPPDKLVALGASIAAAEGLGY